MTAAPRIGPQNREVRSELKRGCIAAKARRQRIRFALPEGVGWGFTSPHSEPSTVPWVCPPYAGCCRSGSAARRAGPIAMRSPTPPAVNRRSLHKADAVLSCYVGGSTLSAVLRPYLLNQKAKRLLQAVATPASKVTALHRGSSGRIPNEDVSPPVVTCDAESDTGRRHRRRFGIFPPRFNYMILEQRCTQE